MAICQGELSHFSQKPFDSGQAAYDTFWCYGPHATGQPLDVAQPGVIILHELAGLTPEVLGLGEAVARAGYTTVLPSFFGMPGRTANGLGLAVNLGHICIKREFRALCARQTGIVVDWVRALCRHVHAECGGAGIGVIGLCFTGGFALALVIEADSPVLVPVLGEPSLPLPILPHLRSEVQLSPSQLAAVKHNVCNRDITVLGYRFTNDWKSPSQRFERMRAELGDHFKGTEIPSHLGNDEGNRRHAHSVLTIDFVDKPGHSTRAALDEILAHLHRQLHIGNAGASG